MSLSFTSWPLGLSRLQMKDILTILGKQLIPAERFGWLSQIAYAVMAGYRPRK